MFIFINSVVVIVWCCFFFVLVNYCVRRVELGTQNIIADLNSVSRIITTCLIPVLVQILADVVETGHHFQLIPVDSYC